jgi:hypothetical protein
MQYGDWRDEQAGRRHAEQHLHGHIGQRVWLNNVAEGVMKVGEWKGP